MKHGPMPLGADPITMKLWDIRHQLDCNVEIIKRDYPDSEPHILPHVIETLTDHVYDRLKELEALIRPAGPSSAEYLDRFPAEVRAHVDRAYQDGYEDGRNSTMESDL